MKTYIYFLRACSHSVNRCNCQLDAVCCSACNGWSLLADMRDSLKQNFVLELWSVSSCFSAFLKKWQSEATNYSLEFASNQVVESTQKVTVT